jgi:hypothetical protein
MADFAQISTETPANQSASTTARRFDGHSRRSWPKPPTTPPFHPVVWTVRLLVVLTEPLRLASRTMRRLLEEPRYVSGGRGLVVVRRNLHEGFWREPLWNPRKRMYGGFAWDLPQDVTDLGHAIFVDHLGFEPAEGLCSAFSRRVFAGITHPEQRWELSTMEIERALRVAVMEVASSSVDLKATCGQQDGRSEC